MSNFKVGDIVRRNDVPRVDEYGVTNHDMRSAKVIEVAPNSYLDKISIRLEVLDHVRSYNNHSKFWVQANYFEKIKPAKPETIVIYRDGDKVYALDKTTGKKTCAKCHPHDEFDFKTGAELAFNRLLGKADKTEEPEPKFKKGDKVRCKTNGSLSNIPKDVIGYIVEPHTSIPDTYLVDLRVEYPAAHTGNGILSNSTGYWFLDTQLERV